MDCEQQGAPEREEGSVDECTADEQPNKKRHRKNSNASTAPQKDGQGPYQNIHHAVEGHIEKPPAKDPFKAKREKLQRPPPLVRLK